MCPFTSRTLKPMLDQSVPGGESAEVLARKGGRSPIVSTGGGGKDIVVSIGWYYLDYGRYLNRWNTGE